MRSLGVIFLFALAFAADLPDLGVPGWSCDAPLMKTSASVPMSAHAIRPADIKVIGAIGDSLTAANGAGAKKGDPLAVILQYRGLAFQIGGDKSLDEHITVTNVLRKFNPDLKGFSTGIGSANVWEVAELNQAVPGAKSVDLPGQARNLIAAAQAHPEIDIANDWKLINVFIGGNDMCAYCNTNGTGAYAPSTFKQNIIDAIQIFKDNLPRTIVSLTGMFDMGMLRKIDKDKYFCDGLHMFECPCEKNKDFSNEQISYACQLLMNSQQEIQDSGVFDTSDDFTMVIQPFFEQTHTPPLTADGEPDLTFFAPDCFHFSQLGHSVTAKYLWNNIMEPVGSKTNAVNLSDFSGQLKCPDPNCPFIRTTKNSQDCSNYVN